MAQAEEQQQSQSQDGAIRAIREAFDMFDKDGSGDIDTKEFQALAFMSGRILTDAQAQAMVDELDTDKSGRIEFNEFLAWFEGKDGDSDSSSSDGDFESAPAELRVLRARLMADYGLKMAEHYIDALEAPSKEAVDAAAGSKPLNAKLEVMAGQHAIADDAGAARASLSLRDAAVDAELRALGAKVCDGGAVPEGSLVLTFDFNVKPGADAAATADALRAVLMLAPEGKVHGATAQVEGEGDDAVVRVTAVMHNPKQEKAAKMVQMAQLKLLTLDLSVWPKPSREAAAADDLAFGLALNASLPSQMLDLVGAMGAASPKTKNFVKLVTALRVAALRFQYDSLAEIADVVPKGAAVEFVEAGGWAFAHKKIDKMLTPMLGMMPPPIAKCYKAVVSSLQSPKTLNVSLVDGFTVGVDFTNFDIFALFPTAEELAAAAAAAADSNDE